MGLKNVGINIIRKSAAYFKISSKQFLFQKPISILKNTKPTLTYQSTDKTFELPRFCSVEMRQARQMNKIAVNQIKNKTAIAYQKASVEDLIRLTSNAIEDSYSRARWTNPSDGQIYNLLKQGETADGKILIRILDKDGAFVKEAAIKPKKIAIIDAFGINKKEDTYPKILPSKSGAIPLEHGEIVKIFAKRNNPFARYTYINISAAISRTGTLSDNLYQVANSSGRLNEKYDFLSVSLGRGINIVKAKTLSEQLKLLQKSPKTNCEFKQFLSTSSKNNTRVLVAAGNGGKYSLTDSLQGNIESVGSLSTKGVISEFSASRNSYFTRHYEQGEFKSNLVHNADGQIIGLNITGQPGMDIKIKYRNEFNDSKVKRVTELKNKLNDLKEKQSICKFYSGEYWKINKEIVPIKHELDKLTQDTIYTNINDFYSSLTGCSYEGTSFSTPVRVAKLALNDMMKGVL